MRLRGYWFFSGFVVEEYSYRWGEFVLVLAVLNAPDKGSEKCRCHRETQYQQHDYYTHV